MIDLIHSLPDFLAAALPNPIRQPVIRKGERLFAQSDTVDAIYFICRGRVKAVRALHSGMQSVMLQATGGEFFAESALAVESYVCDAVATEDSTLSWLPAREIVAALDAGGDFARTFAMAMVANARRQCSRYERVRPKRARDRVLRELTDEGLLERSRPHLRLVGARLRD
jgi:CRP/FNR family transcriptional regulator